MKNKVNCKNCGKEEFVYDSRVKSYKYGDFIQDDIDTFTKGANYILNHLKQKDNETN